MADEGFAGKIGSLLKWLITSQWKSAFRDELSLACQWMEGDTPAVSLMGVFWCQELAVESKPLTMQDIVEVYVQWIQEQGVEPDVAMVDEFTQIAQDPGRVRELEALITPMYPQLKPARIAKAAKQIYADGVAELPVPYVAKNIPER